MRDKFLKQLESAQFTINKNKLQVVVEEYTEEDEQSDQEWPNEKLDNSTVYSSHTSQNISLDNEEAQKMLRDAFIK